MHEIIPYVLKNDNGQDDPPRFAQDLFIDGAVGLISLEPVDMERVVTVIDRSYAVRARSGDRHFGTGSGVPVLAVIPASPVLRCA
jgi:hypothetical protein